LNRLSVIGRPKNARSLNDNFCSGAQYTINVVRFYAAVSFDEDGQFLLVDYLSDLFDLRSDIWDERLAAETRENG